jgi:hypothetical protein
MENENDLSRKEKRTSWITRNSRFVKNSVKVGFLAIVLQMGFIDYEEFRQVENNSHTQTEESVHLHDELKEMEKQLSNLRQIVDTSVTTKKPAGIKKDTILNFSSQ